MNIKTRISNLVIILRSFLANRLFVFPYSTSVKTKSIAVRAEDVLRLGDGEFLNDTIIEFGLK